ncbi:diacylglycerol kinase catalytic domain-containing protein [Ophiostoma piceae UAMH 11346]|uniref:Diacylglycerol kinase catalytic domain-containing protein n=1 Tax=Ophiostoma piceae (strain UAMH 11346) TaxID=1262450 RepID=S3CP19_OPHP1|nr:diacylglycerol kinase catalytic domain-containing protein [Ophiostoma piceae UAMH 11346]
MASFADGRLVVSGQDGSTKTVPENELLFIVEGQKAEGEAAGAVYRIYSLHEATPAADSSDAGAPAPLPKYELSTALLLGQDVQKLPQDFLKKHLLTGTPLVLPSASSPLHVVVSTGSGLRQAKPFYDGVLAPLLQDAFSLTADHGENKESSSASSGNAGNVYSLLITKSKESVTSFAHTLHGPSAQSTQKSPTIILLSGDGGIVDLLNGVSSDSGALGASPHLDPTIALLPLGTGNALFHSLHKPAYEADAAATAASGTAAPSPLVHGLRTLFRGRPAPLPSFEASFAPGSHTVDYTAAAGDASVLQQGGKSIERLQGAIVASYGFHAQLVWESDTPEYRKHGDARFGIVASELIKKSHAYSTDVSLIDTGDSAAEPQAHSIGHEFNYVLATLVSELQQGFTISPASQPLDGQLRLVHFGAVGGSRTMEIMMLAYNKGAHVKEGDVGYEAIDEVEIKILEQDPRWRKVCIDGTIVEIPQGGWMKVRKAARPVLNVITTV